MEAVSCILSRRSIHRLAEPGPDAKQLAVLLSCASAAPDHGKLQSWRFVLVSGTARAGLGMALAEAACDTDPNTDPATLARLRERPFRAPLHISVVASPKPHERIPEWEQLASAACAVQNVCLAAHALGLGTIWVTGPHLDHPRVRTELKIRTGEQLLGWVYVGTPLEERMRKTGPDSMGERVTVLAADTCL